ncbi:hypothetical protein BX265_3875 [Streptomyces sp. TLI_235]|nr:DUF1254 domain-containing protein [Streptomyces sp. TLI_235]PBC79080.1 hypothetical protein BX265_3875 [Streptomyces sp. TLI_235]
MGNPVLVDEATVRGTAAEAWIWGLPMLENYRTLYAQAVDDADPRYIGGFGIFRHYPHPFTPANTDVVTPNNDTPYSLAWLDLRAEPWVLEVPATDRYHVLPLHDLDTCYVGFVGSRTTGDGAGRHLIVGPDHRGTPGEGFDGVLHADTRLIGILGRTYLAGPEDVPALERVQAGYRLSPLSAHLGTEPPPHAPDPIWPVWREEVLDSLEFFSFLDFLLGFFPVLPTDADLRRRLAELGIGAGGFEPAALPLEIREAMARGIADARARLDAAVAESHDSTALFGTRVQLGTDHLGRAIGVVRGLYGLPVEEAWYTCWISESGPDAADGPPLDGAAHDYVLRFPSGGLPPARYFWSVTVYGLPGQLLVANPIDRYAIGDRTPGLTADEDGGLTLRLRHERPEDPREQANWLPVPAGPFMAVLRVYGPDPTVLDGRWPRPPLLARP